MRNAAKWMVCIWPLIVFGSLYYASNYWGKANLNEPSKSLDVLSLLIILGVLLSLYLGYLVGLSEIETWRKVIWILVLLFTGLSLGWLSIFVYAGAYYFVIRRPEDSYNKNSNKSDGYAAD